MKKKNIVIIGGGSASARIAETFKKYGNNCNFSIIGSMADDGGSTGMLRKGQNASALGALRKCFLALSEMDKNIKDSFAYRFEKGELAGHVMGNIFLAAIEKTVGSSEKTLEIMHKILKVKGDVLSSSFDKFTLFAELENRQIIKGESNIDIPKHNGNLKIKRIFLRPKARANNKAIRKIINSDLIIIGPGDLYTTLLPNFLVSGISQAFKKAKAKKIFVVNSITKFGETNDFSVMDFVCEAEKYIGSKVDLVLYNSRKIPQEVMLKYKKESAKKKVKNIGGVKVDRNLNKKKFIGKNLLAKNEPMLDADKLVKALLRFK